jgi:hypothetical protein
MSPAEKGLPTYMSSRIKFLVALCFSGAIAAIGAPIVVAATKDKDDNVSPASTKVTATSMKTVLSATIIVNGKKIPVTSTCTSSSTTGITPKKGLGPWTTSDPSFSGCTDNLGGTDTVNTTGTWTVTFIDARKDENKEGPDSLKLKVPKAGVTITSSAFKRCTITVAPKAAVSLKGTYDDAGTLGFSSAPAPFATSSGCPGGAQTGTAKFTAAYALKPAIKDVS